MNSDALRAFNGQKAKHRKILKMHRKIIRMISTKSYNISYNNTPKNSKIKENSRDRRGPVNIFLIGHLRLELVRIQYFCPEA